MTMVERVARAIYERRNGHGCTPWHHQPKEHRKPYMTDARAAIEAMRVVPQDADAAGVLAAMEQVAPFIEKVTERHGFIAGSAARVAYGDGRLYHAWYNAMLSAALSPSKE